MKRILHICNALNNSGIESYIMNMYENIDRNQIQFDFLLTGEKSYYDDKVVSLGGKIYRHIVRGNRLKQIPVYKKELRILSKNYDTIHIHAMSCKVYFIAKYAKKFGFENIIVHCHGCGHHGIIHNILQRKLNKYVTCRIACSDVAATAMFGKKNLKKVIIVPNSIDTSKFKFCEDVRNDVRHELCLDSSTLAIINVGRFSYEKNHEYILKVFKEIFKKNINAKLFLVGWGELEEDIKKKIIDMNLSKNVIILGMRNDVNRLLNGMDLFLLPSLFEGMPVTVIEAQVNGLPVILNEEITKGVDFSGLLSFESIKVEPKIWASLSLDVIKNNDRKDYSLQAIKCGFDVKKSAELLQEFYLCGCEKYAK